MLEPWEKFEVEKRTAKRILADMDGLAFRLMMLWDIGRALPHPYDAFGREASSIVHDFNGLFSNVSTYVELKGDSPHSGLDTTETRL